MNKVAIIFTVENKGDKGFDGVTSTIEKMSVVMATSVREHMPDVDMYCGCFTNNKISEEIHSRLVNLKVNIVEDIQFDNISFDNTALFLRIFVKDYFAKKLLNQYDYLIYLDVDCLLLKPIEFDFDPTGPIALVDKMPDWVKKFESTITHIPEGNLYYNWIDIINNNNKFLFDLDWSDISKLMQKAADGVFSKNIDTSGLTIIQQTIGAYHCLHELTKDHQLIHYDDLGPQGNFIVLEKMYPAVYTKYKLLIEKVLRSKITNQEGYWEKVKDMYT